MKITAIKQQARRTERYSIYVDGEYAFSLSESALLDSKINRGQELSAGQVREFQKLSDEDKLYQKTIKYIAIRPRSQWEVDFYLQRKKASPALIDKILNKLSKIDLIDDEKFARAFAESRRLLRPTSNRKLKMELKQKRVAGDIIDKIIEADDSAALQALIARKRRQSKYQDDQKLMQYLARQGFSYGDIKDAIGQAHDKVE
jgi:regulatory protein